MNWVAGNRITLYKNGAELFPALIAALDAAVDDVRVETYIFEDDRSGQAIANALIGAAKRGVPVRLLVDGFGSLNTPEAFFVAMERAGVQLLFHRSVRGKWFPTRHRLRRVHRKIALIDGRVGFVGGINFIDDFNQNLSETHPRYDYAVQVEGPVLAEIYAGVYRLWGATKHFSRFRNLWDHHLPTLPTLPNTHPGDAQLAFVTRDNVRHRRDIERAYRSAITTATREILIAVPYFLPGRRLRQTMTTAAKRGVRVEILLQGAADHPVLQLATEAMYANLLDAGIVIYEYRPAMLHAKVAVIDRNWATVGSSNLDPFSLLLNREANIVAFDSAFAETLQRSLREEINANAERLDARVWAQRSRSERLKSWLALGLIRTVSAIFGVALD
jgi:cardiolipin synthase A/B